MREHQDERKRRRRVDTTPWTSGYRVTTEGMGVEILWAPEQLSIASWAVNWAEILKELKLVVNPYWTNVEV